MMATIKKVRSELGLTQKEMAPLLGMPQQAIGRIESGYDGRSETKQHIAHLVAITLLHDHGLIDDLATKLKAT